ncbi:class III lanthipeptide [Streptacidiphilus anmyonensis]|nr:class III lanthipeptide [Streptacidiphilus anmyonensis]
MSVLKLQNLKPRVAPAKASIVSVTSSLSNCCEETRPPSHD